MTEVEEEFKLEFNPEEIVQLASRYGTEQDKNAFEAGTKIREGIDYSRLNLEVIIRWKSPRPIRFIAKNTIDDIESTLKIICNTGTTDRDKVIKLDRLHGVGVPMASAILTATDQEKYTVIDFRALESLGVKNKTSYSVDYYLKYLYKCRQLASDYKISLRTFDRALWQWSKEHRKK